MKDKYEISLWEDYLVSASGSIPAHYEERKLCVIGSNSMTTACRAIEPKLTENINGTHTFTFKMYYTYNEKGEKYSNPFQKYLVNERKLKVLWKDKWYDFIIKDCQEDSSAKSVTYTCKDLFINELSKTGFNLEFDTELENNQGTITELGARVLKGSDWQLDTANSDIVLQKVEENVYEALAQNGFDATGVNPATGADVTVHVTAGDLLLVFYSSAEEKGSFVQFWYAQGGNYQTEGSSMVVLNGQSLSVEGGYWTTEDGASYYIEGLEYIKIPANTSISTRYRANRLVRSQLQVIDPLTDKYCLVYQDSSDSSHEYYSFFETEYSDLSVVTNVITNSKNFKGTSGWVGIMVTNGIYPPYVYGQQYIAKPYLLIPGKSVVYNSGIKDFRSYIPKGFTQKEQYIFRVKAMTDNGGKPSGTYCTTSNMSIRPFIGAYTYDEETKTYAPSGTTYFNTISAATQNGDWVEFVVTCTTSASYEQLKNLAFFALNTPNQKIWVEDIQFFKYLEGQPVIQTDYSELLTYSEDDTLLYNDVYYRCIRESKNHAPTDTTYWASLGSTEPTTARINPGSFSTESLANEVWRLYSAHQVGVKDQKDLVYAYSGTEAGLKTFLSQNNIVPKYGPNGKYEKVRSITGKQSNRFNLLQSLAETFEVWVKFTINHDSTGRTIYTNGKPEKFVSFVNEVGGRNGLCFTYGIDLKAITRDINSDAITTKLIVPANNNQYGENGFCTIARAKDNYPKTSFILNFDYFISQGLLSREQIYNDLYSTNSDYIGYYYYLRIYNTELERITKEIVKKKGEIDKLNAKKTIIDGLIAETEQRISAIEADLAAYAGYNCFCEKEVNDYLKGRGKNDTTAQSAWLIRLGLINNLSIYAAQKTNIDTIINALLARIEVLEEEQNYYLGKIEELDEKFYAKYSRFLQEGSWTSDNYYDDNLYYYDALSTAYTSSKPQVSYNISVTRISSIEEFKNKVFRLGDISYIQDTEFFGYEPDMVTPYKEEVVISEIVSNFDSPQSDEIKVQNYKTQFEDLFQRIAATTQTLQYTTGAYNNTVNNFTTTGEIKDDVLQKSLENSQDLSISGDNDSVVITKEGIVVSDPNDPSKMMKVTATGLQLSEDGGSTWVAAISGNGVQPQAISTGMLATDKINITGGLFPTFKWNDYGITAFMFDSDPVTKSIGTVADKVFVRFDQYGLYGINKENDAGWDLDWRAYNTEDITKNANFGFTWEGFFIKNDYGTGYVEISSKDDFRIMTKSETVGVDDTERIKIGNLGTAESPQYGMRISDEDGNPVLVTDETGQLNLEGTLTVSDGTDNVVIGKQDGDLTGKVIDANGEFIVYLDGSVVARDITITGGSAIGIDINDVTLDGGSWDTV